MESSTVMAGCRLAIGIASLAVCTGIGPAVSQELPILRPAKADYAKICTSGSTLSVPTGVDWSQWRPGSRTASADQALAFAREALSSDPSTDDYERARQVLERLVEGAPGVRAQALYELASTALFGPRTASSDETAVQRLRQSLALGYGRAAVLLGEVYEKGLAGVTPDLKQAELYFKLAVQSRLEDGALKLASLAARVPEIGPPAQWVALAQQMMSARLAAGDCSQLMGMARLYLDGKIVPRSPEVGAEWLESASRAGDPRAARLLGEMLLTGDGLPQDVERGLAILQQSAGAGDIGAALTLGRWYRGDYGSEPQPERARALFEAAVAMTPPDPTALIELGRVNRDGVGGERDFARAEELFRQAADMGSPAGLREVGSLLLAGDPPRTEEGLAALKDAAGRGDVPAAGMVGNWLLTRSLDLAGLTEGLKWLDRAARQGHISSAKVLGRHFENRHEPETAAQYWRIAAAEQDPEAFVQLAVLQHRNLIKPEGEGPDSLLQRAITASEERPWGYVAVGRALRDGLLAEPDPQAGLQMFRKGAEAGEIPAVRETGMALIVGEGTTSDPEEGKLLLQKASERGDQTAQILLARGALLGWFGSADPERARKMLEEAAGSGSVGALHELGGLYSRGAFGELNPQAALEWWLKAAHRGDVDSMRDLANAYAIGFGADPDPGESLLWLERAASRGDGDAMGRLAYIYHAGIGTDPDREKAAYWSRMARAAAPLPTMGGGTVQ